MGRWLAGQCVQVLSHDKRRQDKETNVNFALQVPRPACIAKYNQEMGAVDRHNFYRQGVLRLHMAWRTKTWQTRIQMEIVALALVDFFWPANNYYLNEFMTEMRKKVFFGNLWQFLYREVWIETKTIFYLEVGEISEVKAF